ncbi:hypothetical protein SAMN05444006_107128 [Allgaiera indica]|uniref:Uncharacterized protein n=1 Tax=Allgaiera indica TaxID=765699 RepID=A0A1H2WZ53_9RHOB|nr:hypothetical protein SAMN05444006_107128 [Allgaiera indica]
MEVGKLPPSSWSKYSTGVVIVAPSRPATMATRCETPGAGARRDHNGRIFSRVMRFSLRVTTSKRNPWNENTWPSAGIICAS